MLFCDISSFSLILVLVLVCPAQAIYGQATWYYDGLGACGSRNTDTDYVVALPPLEYAGGTHCNKMVRIQYQEKSVNARVVDLCPTCSSTALDLSLAAFQQLAPLQTGIINVNWNYV